MKLSIGTKLISIYTKAIEIHKKYMVIVVSICIIINENQPDKYASHIRFTEKKNVHIVSPRWIQPILCVDLRLFFRKFQFCQFVKTLQHFPSSQPSWIRMRKEKRKPPGRKNQLVRKEEINWSSSRVFFCSSR